MNKLIIIGNGFDLAHGLNTKYSDMIDFFWNKFLKECVNLNQESKSRYFSIYNDELIKISQTNSLNHDLQKIKDRDGIGSTLSNFVRPSFSYSIKNNFLKGLMETNNFQNWVDIENEYYKLLIFLFQQQQKYGNKEDIDILNSDFELVKNLLTEHLNEELSKPISKINAVFDNMLSNPNAQDFRPYLGIKSAPTIEKILILNFNYTDIVEKLYLKELQEYFGNKTIVEIVHIHGDINDFQNNPMIFGYGDELDKHSKDIVDLNNSNFLKNIKSINYQFTSNYKKVLEFIDYNYFQTVIMGHSCGNSDRTLLNTIFEHENCVSIKPYYHSWDNGDNYFDLVCNIYRNFIRNSSFREKVVEKNLCKSLIQ